MPNDVVQSSASSKSSLSSSTNLSEQHTGSNVNILSGPSPIESNPTTKMCNPAVVSDAACFGDSKQESPELGTNIGSSTSGNVNKVPRIAHGASSTLHHTSGQIKYVREGGVGMYARNISMSSTSSAGNSISSMDNEGIRQAYFNMNSPNSLYTVQGQVCSNSNNRMDAQQVPNHFPTFQAAISHGNNPHMGMPGFPTGATSIAIPLQHHLMQQQNNPSFQSSQAVMFSPYSAIPAALPAVYAFSGTPSHPITTPTPHSANYSFPNAAHEASIASGALSGNQTISQSQIRYYDRTESFSLFFCEVCNRSFELESERDRHMCVHTGKTPYQCVQCGKGFKQKGSLSRHIRIHTGERPFKCQFCPKAFKQKGSLTTHVRIHTGEFPYSCPYCPAKFKQNSNQKSHILRNHKEHVPTDSKRKPKAT